MPNPRSKRRPVVAIDGPAGAGKSTIARAVAAALGFGYLDTGAMYRAVALKALEEGVPLEAAGALAKVAASIGFGHGPGGISIEGKRPGARLRSRKVTAAASVISTHAGVRRAMVAAQRRLLRAGGMVAEGRDIGSVVFPDAEVKVFLTASPKERARRRHAELPPPRPSIAELAAEIAERDRRDSTRARSPLVRAPGAVVVDTTGLTPEQVVERIAGLVERAGRTRDAGGARGDRRAGSGARGSTR